MYLSLTLHASSSTDCKEAELGGRQKGDFLTGAANELADIKSLGKAISGRFPKAGRCCWFKRLTTWCSSGRFTKRKKKAERLNRSTNIPCKFWSSSTGKPLKFLLTQAAIYVFIFKVSSKHLTPLCIPNKQILVSSREQKHRLENTDSLFPEWSSFCQSFPPFFLQSRSLGWS